MSKSDSTAPIGTKYRLPDGRILFVRQSFMGTWKAFYRVLGKTKSGKDGEPTKAVRLPVSLIEEVREFIAQKIEERKTVQE